MNDTPWIKASASGDNGQCVEMRRADGRVEVRDTKNRDGGTLRLSRDQFAALLDGAKHGDLDQLAD